LETRTGKKLSGVVFSDLGQAGSFMSLDWVQKTLREKLGFTPYPATLNLRLSSREEVALWREIQGGTESLELPPPEPAFCSARLFRVGIEAPAGTSEVRLTGAVIVPQVKDYPSDKVEVIAPLRLKDNLGIRDGDHLTLEFLG
jgi:CTP-dependent riboflavin kinase